MAALLDDDETCFWRTLPGEGEGIYVAREGVLLHPVARCFVRLRCLECPKETDMEPMRARSVRRRVECGEGPVGTRDAGGVDQFRSTVRCLRLATSTLPVDEGAATLRWATCSRSWSTIFVSTTLGAGTGRPGCRSCVLKNAEKCCFGAGRGGDVNTLNTNRPIDAELAS